MKQLYLVIILFFGIIYEAGAQKGSVVDSLTHAPIAFATLTIYTGNTTIKRLSKEDGSFAFTDLPAGHYTVTVSFVGYHSKTLPLDLSGVNQVSLSAVSGRLKDVVVTSSRPLVKQEIDRLSYDVQQDPENKGQSALDMLRKVPLVSVDPDNTIKLQGSGSYKILINGRPSALLASSPADVLNAMPANMIQRIEVITTPPAKYDAEGLAGIINIVTVRKTEDGYNGTVNFKFDKPLRQSGNINTTIQQGKFSASVLGGAAEQEFDNKNPYNNYRESFGANPSIFVQYGTKEYAEKIFFAGVDFAYEADSLQLFTGGYKRASLNFNQRYHYATSFTQKTLPAADQSYQLLNDAYFDNISDGVSLNYQLGFRKNKQALFTLSYNYISSGNGQHNEVSASDKVNYSRADYHQENSSGSNEHSFQLDYILPLQKLTVEAGAKAILRKSYSASGVQELTGPYYVDDPALTNGFTYHQDIYSLYNAYTYKSGNWTAKGGARIEHTIIDAVFMTGNTTLQTNYTNLIPSLALLYKVSNGLTLNFGYTNRIGRPGIEQLNPFVDISNPQVISTGNSQLKPELSHLFELAATKTGKGVFSARINYYTSATGIQNVTRLLSDSVSENSFANIGVNHIVRLGINAIYPLSKRFNINLNSALNYIWISSPYAGQYYSNQGYRFSGTVNLTCKAGHDWQFVLNAGYFGPNIYLQGRSNDVFNNSISAVKPFFHQKLTLTALIKNPFVGEYDFTKTSRGADFYQFNTSGNIYFRTWNIALSYKFGRLNKDMKKNQRSINNDDKINIPAN